MEQGAAEIVALMKHLAPEDEGDLIDSIGWTWGEAPTGALVLGEVGGLSDKTLRITIYAGNEKTIVTNARGVRFQNAILQEFGVAPHRAGGKFKGARHPGSAPHPYFYVSWRTLKRRTKSRITRAMKKGIKEGAR